MAAAGCCLLAVFLVFLTSTVDTRDEYTTDKWFHRTHSGLTNVPDDIPKEAVGVYLSNNYITNLTRNSFSHLSTVSFMSLADNTIADIQPGAFYGLISLKEIWLGGNDLTVLKANMFIGLESLDNLVLSNNNINDTEKGCFNGLSRLVNLYMYGNSFTTLKAKMFIGLDSLDKIILTYNHISAIEATTFHGLRNLREIWIDHNNEKLSELGNNTFSGLGNVEILYIHGNKIATIESRLFSGLSKLTDLGLDDNAISEIKPGAFQGLDSLSKVWMYNNKLSTLDSTIFSGLPRDIELTLGKNPLKCDERLCWLKRLEKSGHLSWIQLEDRKLEPDCENGEDWKTLDLDCPIKVECNDPGGVANSVRSGTPWPYPVGTQFSFTCNKCSTGGGTITCLNNGTWTQKPTCTVRTCEGTVTYQNGTVGLQLYTCGTRFSCRPGYTLDGDPEVTCGLDGRVAQLPTCKQMESSTITATTEKPQVITAKPNVSEAYSDVAKTNSSGGAGDQLELVLIIAILAILVLIIVIVVIAVCLKRKGVCCCEGGKVKDGTVVYDTRGSTGSFAREGFPDPTGGFTNPGLAPDPIPASLGEMTVDFSDTKHILERSQSADSEL